MCAQQHNWCRALLRQMGRGSWSPWVGLTLVPVAFCLLLLACPIAYAAFTRPIACQITSVNNPVTTAIDSANNVWIAEPIAGETANKPGPSDLYEYAPAYSACGTLIGPEPGPGPRHLQALDYVERLAIEQTTAHFYVSGVTHNNSAGSVEVFNETGSSLALWTNHDTFNNISNHGSQNGAAVAVDNSTEPLEDPSACGTVPLALSECFVYAAHDEENPQPPAGDGLTQGIEKLSAKGEPVNFGCGTCSGYVKGNEITGTPAGSFGVGSRGLGDVTVGTDGDIYAVNEKQVDQYQPSGQFLRAFSVEEAPRLLNSQVGTPLGGSGVEGGIVVDPVSERLLVSVNAEASGEAKQGAIDEFEIATGKFVGQLTEAAGGTLIQRAGEITVDSRGDLYVVDQQQHAVDVYEPGRFVPSVTLAPVTDRTQAHVSLSGSVNPEGLPPSECRFEYVTQAAYDTEGFDHTQSQECQPSASEIAKGSLTVPYPVQATITGLVPGATYFYRLVAASEGEKGGTAATGALAFTVPSAPTIVSTSADNLSSTYADLRAQIDPRGTTAKYHFQYVDETQFVSTAADPYEAGVSAPIPSAALGSGGPTGGGVESVVQHIGGLTPGTTYHFRVVAESEGGAAPETTYGDDETFTTLPEESPGLPDGRAYELVTPPGKAGGDMFGKPESNGEFFNQDLGTPSESGEGFLLETFAAFGEFPFAGKSAYVFLRTGSGWTYSSLASPSLGVQTIGSDGVLFDSADLSRVAVNDGVGAEVSAGGERMTSLVGPPGGSYVTLHTDAPHYVSEPSREGTQVVGASSDLSRVVLATENNSACPGAKNLEHGDLLCEWTGGYETMEGGELGPELKLVNVDSEGSLLSRCGATLGWKEGSVYPVTHGAVSANGSRIIFTVPDPSAKNAGKGCWNGVSENAPQLYMRTGNETIKLSAPEGTVNDPTGQHPAEYVGASEDGAKVFFLSEAWLTANHPVGHDLELYECEIVENEGKTECELTRVSFGDAGSPGSAGGAKVLTVPAISADGAAVYFTAAGVLAPGASPQTGDLVNLYRYDTETTTTNYVATVYTYDYPNPGYRGLEARANWYTTPNGDYLLFATSRELTGYSTVGTCKEVPGNQGVSNGHCDELYRYDAATGGLICVSCDPSGAPPVSNALFARSAPANPASGPMRAMSDDGSYVFFDSADPLVSTAENHTLDVYEWHEGRIALISSGSDTDPSFFLGASPLYTADGEKVEGGNVFFGTHAKLVAQDIDSNGDVYDARICREAEPCIKPPSGGTAQCEGDACQKPPAEPTDETPASLAFSGAGNFSDEAVSRVAPKVVPPTRAQELAKALATCRKGAKRKRTVCEKKARTKYGPKAKAKSKSKARKSSEKPATKGGK
jgi:hypothetical protein